MVGDSSSPVSALPIVSASSVEDVDDNLLVKILVRGLLTSKHAFQCKLVPKHWQSLISSPFFVKSWKEFQKVHHQPLPFTLVTNLKIRSGLDDHYIVSNAASRHHLYSNPKDSTWGFCLVSGMEGRGEEDAPMFALRLHVMTCFMSLNSTRGYEADGILYMQPTNPAVGSSSTLPNQ
ncbi:hypothetical protein Tsubulata_026536 [Turnera subulata]|uniref:F-box domain-containing protein n=1 Tax=Turnera subulata TaxID=218843 RepID=A0A9Q0FGZ5_9ROSI|nr:hypothetical protein Tsubulata_026536 [Turnera subulata]